MKVKKQASSKEDYSVIDNLAGASPKRKKKKKKKQEQTEEIQVNEKTEAEAPSDKTEASSQRQEARRKRARSEKPCFGRYMIPQLPRRTAPKDPRNGYQ